MKNPAVSRQAPEAGVSACSVSPCPLRRLTGIAAALAAMSMAYPAAGQTILSALNGDQEITREWLAAVYVDAGDGVGALASAKFDYSGPSPGVAVFDYRFAWTVEREDPDTGVWDPVELEGGGTAFHDDPFTVAMDDTSPQTTQSSSVNLKLAAPPDLYVRYRVAVALERLNGVWATVDGPLTSTGMQLYWFGNDDPDDDALNIISEVTGVGFTQRYALDGATVATKRSFRVSTSLDIRRFDAFNEPPVNDIVQFRYRFRLVRDDDGTEIPLAQSQFNRNHSVPTFEQVWVFAFPATVSVDQTFALRPAAQIDSVATTYTVYVEVEHTEEPGVLRTSNEEAQDAQRLLHFNSSLSYGGFATTLRDFTNNPAATAVVSASFITVELANPSGHLTAHPGYTYASPGTVTARLFAGGGLTAVSPSPAIAVTPPAAPDAGTAAGIRFTRSGLTLTLFGLRAQIEARLPQGMGVGDWSEDRELDSWLPFGEHNLNAQLVPAPPFLTYDRGGAVFYVFEESKPVGLAAVQLDWTVASGTFTSSTVSNHHYVRSGFVEKLANSPVAPQLRFKRSNEGYYAGLVETPATAEATWHHGPSNGAEMSVEFGFGPVSFHTHFPYNTEIIVDTGGAMFITNDLVTGGALEDVQPVVVRYRADCPDDPCQGAAPPDIRDFRLAPDANRLAFTPNGGLVGRGELLGVAEARRLKWGGTPAGTYAQQTDPFTEGVFVMAGVFMSGGAVPSATAGADALHYAGYLSGDESGTGAPVMYLPGTSAFFAGAGYYPGTNLEVTGAPIAGLANISGTEVDYLLGDCAKFYVRPAGVSGKLEVVPGSFPVAPDSLLIQGYPFTFDFYGIAYTHSLMRVDISIVTGSVDLVGPSDFTLPFELLTFTCTGQLDELFPPNPPHPAVLGYWLADIDIYTARFVSTDSCDPGAEASLLLGIEGHSTLLDTSLAGSVGIRNNGHLISKAYSDSAGYEEEITSRLRGPNNFTLDGPDNERYRLVSVSEAYYNDFASAMDTTFGAGRLNFATKMDVPFFEDLRAHLQTTARRDTDPGATAYVAGGWQEGGSNFFDTAFFDTNNRGFPGGVAWNIYRGQTDDPASLPYVTRAKQSWLGVVNFDYPLRWSTTLRSFESFEPKRNELLVIEVDHEVLYLSAENAELKFGVKYEGMPKISLASFVFNAVDEQTGALNAFVQALGNEAFDYMRGGVDAMGDLLSDRADALIDEFFDLTIGAAIDDIHDNLQAYLLANPVPNVSDWLDEIDAEVAAAAAEIQTALGEIGDVAATATSILETVNRLIGKVEAGIAAVNSTFVVRTDFEVVKISDPSQLLPGETELKGLLARDDAEADFEILQNLIALLLDQLGNEIGGNLADLLGDILAAPVGELNDLLNEKIEKTKPTLVRITEVLDQIAAVVGQVRDATEAAGAITNEIDGIVSTAGNIIDDLTDAIADAIEIYLKQIAPDPSQFLEYTAAEVKERLRQEAHDLIAASQIISEIQLVLRQHLYDLETRMREGIDTAFAAVNRTVRDLFGEFLAEIDNEINGLLGDVGGVLGAAQFDGYAHINGDALRLLRIDAAMQFKLPDDFEFKGFFQIKQLESDGTGSCSLGTPTNPANEVTAGALGIPVRWLDSKIEMDIEGKFTFSNKPLGMGGRIEMTDGEINFQAFKITAFGAAMSFGASENYLAAKLGMQFQDYKMAGGIFFGRTCTIDPLRMVNEDVADVLGTPNPTFTGGYTYGEVWLPISEMLGIPSTCMFRISAGVGAGAFFFVEGPTFGGQMFLGVSGEALCVVSITGEVSLVGVMEGTDLRFQGRGTLAGEVGPCPLCIKFKKTAKVKFQNKSWSVSL